MVWSESQAVVVVLLAWVLPMMVPTQLEQARGAAVI